MESAMLFEEIISQFSYVGKIDRVCPLTNITFFVGAGFGKAWDERFPTGNDLFTIPREIVFKSDYLSKYLTASFGVFDSDLTPSLLKDVVYSINMQLKYPEIRTRYIDAYNGQHLLDRIKVIIKSNFERTTPLNHWNESSGKFELDKVTEDQKLILKFFAFLSEQQSGHLPFPQGIRRHFITTNYDFLIEIILDNILGEDDSMFIYQYRGFTPISVNADESLNILQDHWLVDNIIKINGGFEIFRNSPDKNVLDYRKKDFKSLISNPPVIMLPSKEQDYLDPYFKSIFPKAVRLLQESKILILIGYSIPEEDSLIRFILRQFAEDEADSLGKMIFYIDLKNDEVKREKLDSIFSYMKVRKKEDRSFYQLFSGKFTDWIKEVLQHAEKRKKRRKVRSV